MARGRRRLHTAGRSPLAGTYKGKEQLFGGFFGGLAEQAGGTFTAEIESLVAEGDLVVALVHHTGTREGRALSTHDVVVYRFEAGRVVEASRLVRSLRDRRVLVLSPERSGSD